MNRRHWIKATGLACPTILTASKTADAPVVIGHGEFRYRLNKKWSQADHTKVPLNNCHEMVQASDGRLFLLTDHRSNNVLVYEPNGKLVDHWTLNLAGAHGLSLQREGERETLWITQTRGRVIQTSLEGELIRELPTTRKLSGKKPHPSNPTEMTIASDGSLYVIDGYGTQSIFHYSAEGKFLKKFGGKSTQPISKGKFLQAHGIALDERGKEPLLVCTGRIRNEFCWFDLEGNYVKTIYLPGAFMSRPVIRGNELYSGVCFGFKAHDYRMWQGRGFIIILDQHDRVISAPGAAAPAYEGENMLPLMKNDDSFHNVHDVCVDQEGDLYACQWNSGKVPPYKLERV